MNTALLLFLCLGCLGAFDTLYYHEYKLRLPSQPQCRNELILHASRDFVYSILFGTIGWVTWNGLLTWAFGALLAAEIYITLSDFVEEDRIRKLPPGERIMHAIMGINYGILLASLFPHLLAWSKLPTGFDRASYGMLSWLLTAMSAGVCLSGIRDLMSAQPMPTEPPSAA